MFGVPEALLSDRGTNLLSHLMLDVCRLLGIEKLNTTSYHPECDGMIERFNRTLKNMLRKRASQFGTQWDNHLPALLWAYRNAPHSSTGEKPSFLLFGWDCRSPTEAALLPVGGDTETTTVEDYRQEMILSLSSARETALKSIRKAQKQYKAGYDRKSDDYSYRIGDWVLIRFPSDEAGCFRKLSRPWHGPYRVTSCNDTNVTAVKVYFPLEDPIQVHQTRVKPCPQGFTAGFYWYGTKRKGPGRPPRWVERLLLDSGSDAEGCVPDETSTSTSDGGGSSSVPGGSGCGDVSHVGDSSAAAADSEVSSTAAADPVTAASDSEVNGGGLTPDSTPTHANSRPRDAGDQDQRHTHYSLRTARRPPDRLT